jgi:hypothetical protein
MTDADGTQLIVSVSAHRARRGLNQLGEGHVSARTASGDREAVSGLRHRLRDAVAAADGAA